MTIHTEKEIAKFDTLAPDFWNHDGSFKALHKINPIRLKFIEELIDLPNKSVADIGCGGGILAESLDDKGAVVTAIDLSEIGIKVAKEHQLQSGSKVDYRVQSVNDFANETKKQGLLDAVFCMEMLEHVKVPKDIISYCASMIKPGGLAVFSSINRTKKANLLAIIIAEYIIGMVPKGTHDAKLFIKPSEMQNMAASANLVPLDIIGFKYSLFDNDFMRCQNTDINYIFAFKKIKDS